ncbi:hypothetical protein A9Q87_06930 [Flavobacteriales bacterium 34_180_T64]|nr:hypothetical protein A9Q87_06930 [Flavobacteriales bacterium 34_180_T64]
MKNVFLVFLLILMYSCSEQKEPLPGETEFQLEMNASYKDARTSPLKEKDRKSFKGLDFFKFDSTYVVSAKLVRTPDEEPFEMKTTTDRLPVYVKYGIVEFLIQGKPYQLNIYQNLDLLKKEGYEDYLFLPFLDNTNGEESYGGGRYVECRIPEDDNISIDFNTAYNPYCAYNAKYSCPIVPRENYLDIEVRAGVKAFDKH